mmetsp:Transcript_41255/g.105056  ORF Transcript_41255/g.105056 Transcript_41255/m.105056 type:complete len:332 (-) Transcript_41255:70-1065(-)
MHKTVLVVFAEHIWNSLRCNPTAAAGDDDRSPSKYFRRPKLLRVLVAGNKEVDTVALGQAIPLVAAPDRRHVRDDNLPSCSGVVQFFLHPQTLLIPDVGKPLGTIPHGSRPGGHACGIRAAVQQATDIVAGGLVWWKCLEHIGIHEKVLHAEVRVVDPLHVVQRGCHPPIRAPRVADVLLPLGSEHVAAPIVVAKYTQPSLTIQPGAPIHILKDGLELTCPTPLERGMTTLSIDASPIEVVPHVQDVVWLMLDGSFSHLLGDLQLGSVVDADDELPVKHGEQLRPLVGRDRRHMRPVHDSSPVANHEHIVFFGVVHKADICQPHAVIIQSL